MSSLTLLLALHIAGGTTALLAGPLAMVSRKGGRLHRRAGYIFAATLGAGCVSAVPLALARGDNMLLTIAVMTACLIVGGLRAPRLRRGARPALPDWAATALLACFGLWLAASAGGDVTATFFGIGSLVLAGLQASQLRAPNPDWLLAHIAGLGGAYTATFTAFLTVNLTFLPKAVVFIGPSLVGTALITLAIQHHRTRPARVHA